MKKNQITCTPLIPTREEFHRQWAGPVSVADFNGYGPSPFHLNELFRAASFNREMKMLTGGKRYGAR